MIGLPLTLPLDVTAQRNWGILSEAMDDDLPDGGDAPTPGMMALVISLTPAEARAVAVALMNILGQPEALDADLADQIGWAGTQ